MFTYHVKRLIHRPIVARVILAATIILTLVVGCGKSESTATPVPPTPTPTTTPTATATATPVLPTPTLTLPTDTPVSEGASALATLLPSPEATPTNTPVPLPLRVEPTDLSFVDSGQRLGAGGNFLDAALGDLDGDGDLDAVIGNGEHEEGNGVLLNDGNGVFVESGQSFGSVSGVALGDLDGDGDLDAFATSLNRAGRVWLNDGGTFDDSGQMLSTVLAQKVALGDLDGDGDLDAFVARERENTVWLNDGQGEFSDSGQSLGNMGTEAVALGDLDGDGDLDALTGGWDEGGIIWLNDGQGTLIESGQIPSPDFLHIKSIALGDVDGDGDLDVFLTAFGTHSKGLWYNAGGIQGGAPGTLVDSDQSLPSMHVGGVALGDIDGDGDLDAFIGIDTGGERDSSDNLVGSGNMVWLNDGGAQGGTPGVFVDSGLRLGQASSQDMLLGDLDGDGDLDAFVVNREEFSVPNSHPEALITSKVWFNTTPLPTLDSSSKAGTMASLQALPIDEFFEESFRQLLLRDPDTLVWDGLAKEYGIENDRFTDISDAYTRETQGLESAVLDLLHTYDREALSPEQQISYDVYEWYLDDRVRGHEFAYYDYPVNSMSIASADFVILDLMTDIFPITDNKDAEDYIARLSEFDTWMAQLLQGLKIREQAGVIPPRLMVEQSVDQIGEHIKMRDPGSFDVEEIELYSTFRDRLEQVDGMSQEQRASLLAAARTEIEDTVIPAYLELREYVLHLRDIATDDAGLPKLQRGREYYAQRLRHHTTTDMSAGEIHELGLAEVARLQAEMRQAAHTQLGYPQDIGMYDLTQRLWAEGEHLQGDALLAEFQRLLDGVKRASRDYFDLFPKADLLIEFDPLASVNYYRGPSSDGSRLGTYFATAGGMSSTMAPVTFYHEAIPGHHVESALERDLPTFRKLIDNSAYSEGWALYAERLAWEMGLFEDDAPGNLGRLQLELIRAARLVVDTGLNDQGWTWDEATSYMGGALGMQYNPGYLVRFITLPGQGCAYTIGYLKIMELRQKAMDQLGEQFDIQEFHNVILGNGAVPLEMLERLVQDYIDARLAASFPHPFDVAWDDYTLFGEGLIKAEQATLDDLPGATVYHIDLQIPDDLALLQGQEQVLYTNQESRALDEVCFRLYANAVGGTVAVAALKVDGQGVQPVLEGMNSVLRVPLPQALQPGEQVVIEMDFEIQPPRHLDNNYGTFSYVDGVLALDGWYPAVAVYDDEGTRPEPAEGWNLDVRSSGDLTYLDASFYLVRVSAPADLTIITSGSQVGHEREGERRVATFAAGPSRDFYLVASDRYTVVSATVGETTINNYAPAAHVDGAELALEYAGAALASLNERLGVYPYAEFDIVSTPMQGVGVEYAGVVVLAFDAYDLDRNIPGTPLLLLESVIAHEAAHQWFYNVVGNDQSDEPWLDEAIVQYVTGLYHLDVGGERAAQDWYDYLYYRWGYADQAEIPIGMSLTDYTDGMEYSGIVYGRGPLFVTALAEEMGQESFDGFLRDYYESHKWGIGTTGAFRQLAEGHCRCDLTALFEEWVYE